MLTLANYFLWVQAFFYPKFFYHYQFTSFFEQLCEEYKIVEYYFIKRPYGFFLFTGEGDPYYLLMSTYEDLVTHFEIALSEGAPSRLLKALVPQDVIPFFWQTSDGYYDDSKVKHWQGCLHPIDNTICIDGDIYLYSLYRPTLTELPLRQVLTSYRDYLSYLDPQKIH